MYAIACASCHGTIGEGGVGPALNSQEFQDSYDDQVLFDTISNGHTATPMVAWGENLSDEQINLLVQYIRVLGGATPTTSTLSFSGQIAPIFQSKCQVCHNQQTSIGGWDSTSYQAVMESGNNGPVIVPGDPENSLLAQLVQGEGKLMPPSGQLPSSDIQTILDWITAGALEN